MDKYLKGNFSFRCSKENNRFPSSKHKPKVSTLNNIHSSLINELKNIKKKQIKKSNLNNSNKTNNSNNFKDFIKSNINYIKNKNCNFDNLNVSKTKVENIIQDNNKFKNYFIKLKSLKKNKISTANNISDNKIRFQNINNIVNNDVLNKNIYNKGNNNKSNNSKINKNIDTKNNSKSNINYERKLLSISPNIFLKTKIKLNNISSKKSKTLLFNSSVTSLGSSINIKNKSNNKKIFKILEEIYKGKYNNVYIGYDIINKNEVIIKKFLKKVNNNYKRIYSIKNEYNIIKKMNHPNIVKVIDFIETYDDYRIIFNKIEGKNLSEINNNKYSINNEQLCKLIIKKLVSIIYYVHSNNIVHRDLKLENIIINNTLNDIVLIDFGISSYNNNEKIEITNGTPYYISPEVIKKEQVYPKKCDIWAIGIIFYKLFTGNFPFEGSNEIELYNNIINKKLEKIDNISDSGYKLIKKILNKNYQKRPNITDILNNKYLI